MTPVLDLPPLAPGVAVEAIGKDSVLEKAGLQPGDLLVSWRRLPTAPTTERDQGGELATPYDWLWLTTEQLPRGPVEVEVLRGSERLRAILKEGRPDSEVTSHRAWSRQAPPRVIHSELRSWVLLVEGTRLEDAGALLESIERFQAALDENPRHFARSLVLRFIAFSLKRTNALEEARTKVEEAIELSEIVTERETQLSTAALKSELAALALDEGDLTSAQTLFEAVLATQRELAPESLALADSLTGLASVVRRLGAMDEAVVLLEHALEIYARLAPGSPGEATSLNGLGVIALRKGYLPEAARLFDEAIGLWKTLRPRGRDMAVVLQNRGATARQLGHAEEAMGYYAASLEIKEQWYPGGLEVANTLNSMAGVAFMREEVNRAADLLEKALEIRQRLAPRTLLEARTLQGLGTIEMKRRRFDRALEYLQRATGIQLELAPRSLDLSSSLIQLGSVHQLRGEAADALRTYTQALEIQDALAPGGLQVSQTKSLIGLLAKQLGDSTKAIKYLSEALSLRLELAPESDETAMLYLWIGRTYLDFGDMPSVARAENRLMALDYFLKGLDSLETQFRLFGGSYEARAGLRAQQNQFYQLALDLQVDIGQYDDAFHTVERSRARSFLEQLAERDLVLDLPDGLEQRRLAVAQDYGKAQKALVGLDRRRHPETIDSLIDELRRLRDQARAVEEEFRRTSPSIAALRYPTPLTVDGVRAALDPGVTLVAFDTGPSHGHVFTLSRELGLQLARLPITEDDLRARIAIFRREIARVRTQGSPRSENLRTLAENLYSDLLGPVEESIASAERLMIVPDGPLQYLPWNALIRHDQENQPQFLVEWKPLHFVLSATTYVETRRLHGEAASNSQRPTLAIGEVLYGEPARPAEPSKDGEHLGELATTHLQHPSQRLPPLPSSRFELEGISMALAGSRPIEFLTGPAAREEELVLRAPEASILHFSVHAVVDEISPLSSYLALNRPPSPEAEGPSDGTLQLWEILDGLRLDADLVFLSACDTALGSEQSGEGPQGFVRAFQVAGARTVAASLWRVEDRSTAHLITRFYHHLEAGLAKDEALRQAQVELIQGKAGFPRETGTPAEVETFSAPYHWASFQLYGDWRQAF